MVAVATGTGRGLLVLSDKGWRQARVDWRLFNYREQSTNIYLDTFIAVTSVMVLSRSSLANIFSLVAVYEIWFHKQSCNMVLHITPHIFASVAA